MQLATITVGTTLNFTTQVAEYPANAWTLHYRLVPRATGAAIELTGAPDSDDATLHRVQASAAITDDWVAGLYSWASWVTNGSEVYDLSQGTVKLLPDPRTSTAPLDNRSAARIALEAAEAALATWTPTMRSYTINGRSMTFATAQEVVPIVSYWAIRVQQEERAERMAKGLADPRKTVLRLGRV